MNIDLLKVYNRFYESISYRKNHDGMVGLGFGAL